MKLAACQRFHPDQSPDGWDIEPIKNRLWLEYGSGLTDAERCDGVFPVFGSNGQVGFHDAYLVEGPGILVGRKGSVGEVHFSENHFWPIDTVYYVRRLKDDDDWRYLYYLLTFLNLDQLNAATGVPGLTRRDAHFILGAFPKPEEQTEIANLLRLADDVIAAAEAKLTAARRLKTALMQQLFTRGIPGRHNCFKQTKIGAIPASWEVERMSSILAEDIYNGISPLSRPAPPGRPILNVSCISAGKCDPAFHTYVDIEDEPDPSLLSKPGDFYVLRGNGNRAYVATGGLLTKTPPEGSIFSDLLIKIPFAPDKTAEGFMPLLWQSQRFLRSLQSKAVSGSGLWKIGLREIRRHEFPLPPLEEQKEIVAIIRSCDESIDACEMELDCLHRLKRSLLQNLLTGRVRVRVEAQAAAVKTALAVDCLQPAEQAST